MPFDRTFQALADSDQNDLEYLSHDTNHPDVIH